MKKILFISFLLTSGCKDYGEQTSAMRSSYFSGFYPAALAELESSDLKERAQDLVLYHLEKAMILDRLGEKDKAKQSLFAADKISDKLYTVSVLNSAKSFVVNDQAQDYKGEDFEKVAIHIILALIFIEEKNLKSALVEARKTSDVLREITKDYDVKYNSYQEDACARYISGLIFEASGEIDDAIIDYRTAYNLYKNPKLRMVYSGGVPDGLKQALVKLAKKRDRQDILKIVEEQEEDTAIQSVSKGEVVVIHQVGNIARKQAKEFIFSWGRQIIRFSYPYYPIRRYLNSAKTGIGINGQFFTADLVSDLDAIAHQTLEDQRGRMILKSSARLLAKGQLVEQAKKNFGLLGEIAANVFTVATETADTRSWTLLPETFQITRIALVPGTYAAEIYTGGKMRLEDIVIEKNKITILRAVGF